MPIYQLDVHCPQIDASAWVAPSADVIGRVHIGANASLWYGAVARGDTARIQIGAGSNVQDGAVLHADAHAPLTIGSDVTIGHRAVVHGCTIGDESLIGIGAIILNGARIGRNCLVGAGALVTENREFPDCSMILGSPAKVVRVLTPEQIEGLRASARHYAANARRFREGSSRLDLPCAPLGELTPAR